jgi:hypothetical protein
MARSQDESLPLPSSSLWTDSLSIPLGQGTLLDKVSDIEEARVVFNATLTTLNVNTNNDPGVAAILDLLSKYPEGFIAQFNAFANDKTILKDARDAMMGFLTGTSRDEAKKQLGPRRWGLSAINKMIMTKYESLS